MIFVDFLNTFLTEVYDCHGQSLNLKRKSTTFQKDSSQEDSSQEDSSRENSSKNRRPHIGNAPWGMACGQARSSQAGPGRSVISYTCSTRGAPRHQVSGGAFLIGPVALSGGPAVRATRLLEARFGLFVKKTSFMEQSQELSQSLSLLP